MLFVRVAAVATLALLSAGAFVLLQPHARAVAQTACSNLDVNVNGVPVRILFARNGAVQRYQITRNVDTEAGHDAIVALSKRYGPEEVNAPPMKIVEYRDTGGGMRVPVKAIDSCGRVIPFQ